MARAVWKGPFVEESLMKKVDKYKDDPKKIPIKTWSRNSTIIPDFVGHSFLIHNGRIFIPDFFTELMVGQKLGEYAPTITYYGHTADKKVKKGLYTQKYIRLKQETLNNSKTNQKDHGSVQPTKCSL